MICSRNLKSYRCYAYRFYSGKTNPDNSLIKSFKIWFNELVNYDDNDKYNQDQFLEYVLPYYNPSELNEDKYKKIKASNFKTIIKMNEKFHVGDENQWHVNEIRLEKKVDDGKMNHLVMLHGYGASSCWFYKNFKGLIEKSNKNLVIHGLDLIGFGLSGRPNYKFHNDFHTKPSLDIKTEGVKFGKKQQCIQCKAMRRGKNWCNCDDNGSVIVQKEQIFEYVENQRSLVEEVEDLYIESLESWRVENKVEKFDLLAHSLGGYIGLSYLLRYPERVGKIIMVSPGGVERSPFAISNPEYTKILKGDTGELKIPISNHVHSYGFLGRFGLISDNFQLIWRMRVSVFTFLRWIGPFGPKIIIDRNVDKLKRSGNITDEREIELFIKYIYSCSVRTSISETTINRIFDATIVGKIPILDKIRDYTEKQRIKDKKFLWVYGEHDFMYQECGTEAIKELKKLGGKETQYEFASISNSGHNMYLDNDREFNDRVLKFLD